MDRRTFLKNTGLAATWAGVSVHISGCSDDSPSGPSSDFVGTVTGGGHSHEGARVTQAQALAGNAVMLTLTGGHEHTVNLSAPQVMAIAAGTRVSEDTEPDQTGHSHTVTFN